MTGAPSISAGVILIRRQQGALQVFLVQNATTGSWGFPKGHIEAGETIPEAARREAQEETGLMSFTLGVKLGTVVRTSGPKKDPRIIHYFLVDEFVELKQWTVADHREQRAILWLPLSAALDRLTHPEEREFLRTIFAGEITAEHHG